MGGGWVCDEKVGENGGVMEEREGWEECYEWY